MHVKVKVNSNYSIAQIKIEWICVYDENSCTLSHVGWKTRQPWDWSECKPKNWTELMRGGFKQGLCHDQLIEGIQWVNLVGFVRFRRAEDTWSARKSDRTMPLLIFPPIRFSVEISTVNCHNRRIPLETARLSYDKRLTTIYQHTNFDVATQIDISFIKRGDKFRDKQTHFISLSNVRVKPITCTDLWKPADNWCLQIDNIFIGFPETHWFFFVFEFSEGPFNVCWSTAHFLTLASDVMDFT